MKKIIAIILAVILTVSFAVSVSAENAVPNTTTLTTSVPDAEYTLNIPVDQVIPYGDTDVMIGDVKVTESSGFAVGKDLKISVIYTDFEAEGVTTKIPFELYFTYNDNTDIDINDVDHVMKVDSGSAIMFEGMSSTKVNEFATIRGYANKARYLRLISNSNDWGKALAGDYTATITFSAEVVAE